MFELSDIITKYSIVMFLLSGILIFLVDINELKAKNLKREINMAKVTGYSLIAIALLFFIINLFL